VNTGGTKGGGLIDITKSNAGSSSTGSGGVQACVSSGTDAQPAPLDIYVMLDISMSMMDTTAGGGSKWDAVKRAITAFVQDTTSANLSVGIQYFPLRKANVPKSCSADNECAGAGGPCTLKWCSKYSTLVPNGIAVCKADTDCKAIPTLADYGPCANGACTADTTKKCASDAECKLSTPFDFGTCVAIGHCSKAASVACSSLNTACGPDASGVDRGTCTAATSSFCFHGTECSQAAYAAPAVEIQALPAASTALLASLNAQQPDGDTPTGPAMRGAIDHAREWANAHPGHTVVAVLATDGLPTECLPDNVGFSATTPLDTLVKEVEGVAADGRLGSPSISTFVIGVFSGADTQAPGNLERMAKAGGTTKAQLVDTAGDVTKQFVDALNAVRASRLACEFLVPQPEKGNKLDYFQVNVAYKEGANASSLFYVGSPDRCDPATGGWYYDDLKGENASKIIVCPKTCMDFQSSKGSVEIQLGCATAIK
jgi:Mg-chelatase subunit ChlD